MALPLNTWIPESVVMSLGSIPIIDYRWYLDRVRELRF